MAAWMAIVVTAIACTAMLVDIVRGHWHRWPLYGSLAVLGCAGPGVLLHASDEWTEQYMDGVCTVGAASVHARFVIELCAIGALHPHGNPLPIGESLPIL